MSRETVSDRGKGLFWPSDWISDRICRYVQGSLRVSYARINTLEPLTEPNERKRRVRNVECISVVQVAYGVPSGLREQALRRAERVGHGIPVKGCFVTREEWVPVVSGSD